MVWLINIIIVLIAILHIYFLILEMFLWEKPIGLKAFGLSAENAAISKVLAANQGLYNGFLAAGLIWSLFLTTPFNNQVQYFFLSCILIAGIYGGLSASKKILYVQASPALIALLLLLFF